MLSQILERRRSKVSRSMEPATNTPFRDGEMHACFAAGDKSLPNEGPNRKERRQRLSDKVVRNNRANPKKRIRVFDKMAYFALSYGQRKK